ncbi:MAG TPA: VWA domain-containing protein, partial [Burkholderiaceae bacterium]|nr:VWA domain-containing protein [Burkholderiaceae bacterium]
RIDAAIARSYPGARADLTRRRAHELAQRRPATLRRWPLTCALDTLARHALGDATAVDTANSAVLQTMLAHADALRAGDAGPLDSARVASHICAALGVPALARGRRHTGAATGATSAAFMAPGASLSDPGDDIAANATQGVGATFVPSAASGRADRGATPAKHAMHRAAATIGDPRPDATTLLTQPPAAPADPAQVLSRDDGEPPGRAHPIDEWDYRQQRLLRHWCTLIERRQHGGDTAFIHSVRRRHAELARRVRRQFAAWRPEGLQRVHGASDGDEVLLDRVIEAIVNRRAGLFDDRAWYVRRDRAQRDVATAFLVDTSASTDFVLPDGVVGPPRPAPSVQADAVYLYDLALSAPPPLPPKRRVIDVAKDALGLMCDALHTLGDCFAVYTFSGHGRARVDFRIVKSFDEAVSSRTAGSLAALRPHGATRSGAAIRHAAAQLVRQSQRRRVLIVVTDGYPEDIDYGPQPRDLRYGLEDTAHALREAQASGVQTFCLSIDPAGHDYLRRMCPPQRYLVISDLAALPGELAKVYQAMTRPAP